MTAQSKRPARSMQEMLARSYRANDGMLELVVTGFTPADWSARHGEANDAAWVLGHIATSRRAAARVAGCELANAEWETAYALGSDGNGHPGLRVEDLLADFRATGEMLCEQIERLEDEPFSAAAPFASPMGYRDVGSVLAFLHFHESYHIGQLGLIRRLQGKRGPI